MVDLHGAGKSLHSYIIKTYLYTKQASTGLILLLSVKPLEFVTLSTSRRLSGELKIASSTSIHSRVSSRGHTASNFVDCCRVMKASTFVCLLAVALTLVQVYDAREINGGKSAGLCVCNATSPTAAMAARPVSLLCGTPSADR